ncbi:MAG: type II secretion system protein [Opitutales bacterium]
MKKHKSAFTLIELLTVIAIIGILASILIPTVAKVRDSARGSVCQSNLRQIAMGMVMYTMDHDGLLPTIGDHEQHPTDWIYWHAGRDIRDSAIVPYMGDNFTPEVYRCPGDPNLGQDNPLAGRNPYNYSFSMNIEVSNRAEIGGRLDRIEDPTRIILLAEEERPNDSGAHLTSVHDRLTDRHGGKGHVAFADAHVERVHPDFAAHRANHDPMWRGEEYTGPR